MYMEKQKKKTTKSKTVSKKVKEDKVLVEEKKNTKTIEEEVDVEEIVEEENKKENVKKENKKEDKKKDKKDKKNKKEKKVGFFKSIINFFKDVKSELSKVTWPNKRNMVKYSIATVVFILFFALYFYGIEVIMAWLKSIIVII